ncbi:NAD(P)/FAD-dependent oxidoreductase [Arthrobacter sp. BE255]|uniref:flavin monoamine oxidase family protein n=1 Tax=Arthrobacter sp. BE255 TaxID=2817721 RepID=UPI00286300C1|nr:NAD(P)/FAD-dependent oxidoreductase [Arthrobacter sp. BE255]MDR7159878.1 monoamine oxidase [Arthrobacter sp. BE255]
MSSTNNEAGHQADAIIVGGGLSGMAAAFTLAQEGLTVTVLEAKDRVGGRTHSDPDTPGGPLDLGGMLIGTTHDRSRLLGETLGLSSVPARPSGSMTYRAEGQVVRAPDGGYPDAVAGSTALDAELRRINGLFDELAELVGAEGPWDIPDHAALDAITVESWLEENVTDAVARRIVRTDLNIIVGADTTEMSMLFWAQYVAKCEGMRALQVTANDALWLGGSQQISQRIAELPGVTVVTGAPVSSVSYTRDSVVIESAQGRFTAPAATIAVPPSAANAIQFSPELPLARRQLQARAPMGRESKVQVRYSRPFWRDAGLSGEVFDLDLGYLSLDVTRPGDEWATIVAFIGGKDYDAWFALGADARKQAVLDSLHAVLGPEAADVLGYHETDWPSVPYTMGAPVTVMPPGLLSKIGDALNAPVGALRFAGTEAASMWTGYMEGAVRAGEAAAHSILASHKTLTAGTV